MYTNTIAMRSDVDLVDVPCGRATGGAVVPFPGLPLLPVWRPRRADDAFAPITASVEDKHNSTRVSVPGCRGRT